MTKEKQPKQPKDKSNYVFGKKFGAALTKISPRTQYEASMLGSLFILGALSWMAVQNIFFTEATIGMRIFSVALWIGFIFFLGSGIVTTFQQYKTYMAVVEAQKLYSQQQDASEADKKELNDGVGASLGSTTAGPASSQPDDTNNKDKIDEKEVIENGKKEE